MPNQRAQNKVRLGGFIDRDLYEQVVAFAKQEGMAGDKFGFAQKLILEALDKQQTRRAKPSRTRKVRQTAAIKPVSGLKPGFSRKPRTVPVQVL